MAWSQCMTTIPRGLLNVKLIEPPCTERYARWCERSKIPHQEEFSPTRFAMMKYWMEFKGVKLYLYELVRKKETNKLHEQ